MKNQKNIALLPLILLIFASCSETSDSKKTADSINAIKVDSSKSPITHIQVNEEDAKFAVDAANGGMAEVELGKLADQKAVNKNVKEFANMMVMDHSKANNELIALAKSKGITLPATIDAEEQKSIDHLTIKSGKEFDKEYVQNMLDDHQKDVKEFEEAVKNCKDADLKEFAIKTLPTLKKHLSAIMVIHDGVR